MKRGRNFVDVKRPTPIHKKCSQSDCQIMCIVRHHTDTPWCLEHGRRKGGKR